MKIWRARAMGREAFEAGCLISSTSPRKGLRRPGIAVSLIPFCLILQSSPATRTPPRARVDGGVVEGSYFGDRATDAVFKGIPFAAPPVGPLRWKPPASVPPWHRIRDAKEFPPICPQRLYSPEFYAGLATRLGGQPAAQRPLTTSEDCLYLSIWTSNFGSAERQPVMVWIHGGGNNGGWGTQGTVNGENLARQGVVLVMIEYRVGALGFIADSALTAESPHHSSGNYGLLDQVAALRWVQRNIAAFGGDPSRVTAFGQSSGAMDITCLMTSPLARGLFQRAISESGACTGPFAALKVPVTSSSVHPPAEESGKHLARALGVSDASDVVAAMRAKSADEILAAMSREPGIAHEVNVDGWVIPEQPDIVFMEGRQLSVPFVVGSNKDEYRAFLSSFGLTSMSGYSEALLGALGSSAPLRAFVPRLLETYPASDTAEAERRLFEANTDAGFGQGARFVARAMARAKQPDVYLYYFTHAVASPSGQALGAFHSGEILLEFGNDLGWPSVPRDQTLRGAMSGYWVQFAATGNPNGRGLPGWPRYEPGTDRHLELGDTIRVGTHLRERQYDLLDDAQSALDAMFRH
jgi:para-nitrobenzyl esterase